MASKYDKLLGALREDDADGAGATELSGLSDVGVTTPTNRNVLVADGDSWESRALVEADISDLGNYLSNVVEDTTPQLGGDLDAQGNSFTDLGDVTFKTGAAGGTLRTGTSAADKFVLQAYDVNDAVYRILIEADAGNDVTLQAIADYWHFEDATDTTKRFDLSLSGATTGTKTLFNFGQTVDRTITIPDATGTLSVFAAAQTDHGVVRADGTGGLLQTSGVIIDDSDNLNVPTGSQYLYDNKNMFSITSAGTFYGDNLRNIGLNAAGTVSDNFIIGDGNAGQEIGRDASGNVDKNMVIGPASTAFRLGRFGANVSSNVAVGTTAGYQAGLGAGTGAGNNRFNTYFGYQAGMNMARLTTVTVENNVVFGSSAGAWGNDNSTGSVDSNVFFGASAGYKVKDGSTSGDVDFNTFVGTNAGREMGFGAVAVTDVRQNVAIGNQAGYQWGSGTAGTHNDNILIGNKAGQGNTTGGSDKLYIENSNASEPLIYGEFDNDFVNINGDFGVGIGNTAPSAKAHIDQNSTTGAMPVITLDQADVSEEFIRLIGESTTDATQSLVDAADLTTPGSIQGWFKIYVEDVQGTGPITDGIYYVPFYSAPTA